MRTHKHKVGQNLGNGATAVKKKGKAFDETHTVTHKVTDTHIPHTHSHTNTNTLSHTERDTDTLTHTNTHTLNRRIRFQLVEISVTITE